MSLASRWGRHTKEPESRRTITNANVRATMTDIPARRRRSWSGLCRRGVPRRERGSADAASAPAGLTGGDLALASGSYLNARATAIRAATQAMLGTKPARRQRLTEDQIAKIVEGLGGLLTLLHNADPLDRTEIYARVGLQMTYRPGTETVIAEVMSPAIDGVLDVCPSNALDKHTVIVSRELAITTA
jgi:hypothetical protein